jgi:HPt (histidine-containing phosphotransfer) domain-containing protein
MEATKEGLKILLAESPSTRPNPELDRLRAAGHHVHRAQTGAEVLGAIDREAYDIVLINLDQPAVTPAEIEEAKQKLEAHKLAVLGVTSGQSVAVGDRAWNECVTWSDLPERITKFSSPATTGHPAPVIDVPAALECTGGDPELLQSLIELYFEQQPDLFAQIRQGIDRRHSELLERAAHSLKGSISVFAAADAVLAASGLEAIGKGSEWGAADAAWIALEKQLARFEPALRSLDESIRRGEITSA